MGDTVGRMTISDVARVASPLAPLVSICPPWCENHTFEEGVVLHEHLRKGERWDVIVTHDDMGGTTIDVAAPGDLRAHEAVALALALIADASMVGWDAAIGLQRTL